MNEKLFTVYVLQSLTDGSFYKGMTADIETRLEQHNAGRTKSTKSNLYI